MSSKPKPKKCDLFLRIVSAVFGLLLFFIVSIYVFAPSYRFETPMPFSGEYIYNPYHKLTCFDWNYYDFRDSANNAGVSVCEYGRGISSARYLCFDYQEEMMIDYPFFQNIHHKQHNVQRLSDDSEIVVLANIEKGFKLREIKHLDSYRLMEVMSPYGIVKDYWDLALSSGHRVNAMANLGSHSDMRYANAVSMEHDGRDKILSSLKTGDSYAISYKVDEEDLPELRNIKIINDSIFVEFSKVSDKICFIGQDAMVKDSLVLVNGGSYAFKEDDSYIRIEAYFADETTIFLNPIVRHRFQYFFDPVLSEMMKERTWLIRIAYVFVVIFLAKYLLCTKNVRDESKGK